MIKSRVPIANPLLSPQLLPKIEAQFLGTNANLVDLDLLTVAPPKPQPVPSGPSPSNPFGLSSSPSGPSSSLTGLKPVGNPFEAKATTPSLNQLASTNTNSIGFEGTYIIMYTDT